MNQKNKRHEHFLRLCGHLGFRPERLAELVRELGPDDSIWVNNQVLRLVSVKNTPDGRLYTLDLYYYGRLIRRSPCFLNPPRRGRRVRMVSEITGVMLLVGISITGAAIAYTFGGGLADSLTRESSCQILRFDVFEIGSGHAYYVVEAQNSGTQEAEFSMRIRAEDGEWKEDPLPQSLAEFESHVWSATQEFGNQTSKRSDYLAEARSDDTVCAAKATSK